MKTITLDNIEEVNNNSIIGIYYKEDGKCLVCNNKEGYYCKGLNSTTMGITSEWVEPSKKKYIKEALDLNAKVYSFSEIRDLIEWLIK